MATGRLLAAFLLSLTVPLLEGSSGWNVAPGAWAALALLPWLGLATLPGGVRAGATPARSALFVAALALVPLALGAGIDLARGAEPRSLAMAAGAGWLALLLWTLASERARGNAASSRAFSVLWLLALPGAAAVRMALSWVPESVAREPRAAAGWPALDPLLYCLRWGRPGGLQETRSSEAALTVLAALLALLAVLGAARAARARGAP